MGTMPSIIDNLEQFNCDLKSDDSIGFDLEKCNWERSESLFSYLGRTVAHLKKEKADFQIQRVSAIGKQFCTLLNELEQKPVSFTSEAAAAPQWQAWLNAGKSVKKFLKIAAENSGSADLQNLFRELAQRLTALQYRMESENPIEAAQPASSELYEKLLAYALQSKQKNPLFVEKELNQRDREKIQEACRYPKFVKLLLKSPEMRDFFLKSVIRDRADVDIFVEYPHLFEKLKNCYLIPRVGRFSKRLLQIEKQEGKEKIVTLPFWTKEGVRRINILDESAKVTLKEGWTISIKETFEVFAKKNGDHGDLELFSSTGISNWNSRELGPLIPRSSEAAHAEEVRDFSSISSSLTYIKNHLPSPVQFFEWLGLFIKKEYRRILLSQEAWWKQLPVFETLSMEEVKQRNPYVSIWDPSTGDFKAVPNRMRKGEWLISANSNRTTADLDLDDRHGYMLVYIPQVDGSYNCYPFGKFAERFAQGFIDKISFLVGTIRAKVVYPDENVFYSQRQHASYPMVYSHEWGLFAMNLIRLDMIKARENNLIFQFGADNCAHWVQSVLEMIKGIKLPNLFIAPILQSDPSNIVMKKIFTVVKQMPEKMRSSMLYLVDFLFGSWRGLYVEEGGQWVWKSHATNPLRKQHLICQPGYLHKQIEDKILGGRIFSGH